MIFILNTSWKFNFRRSWDYFVMYENRFFHKLDFWKNPNFLLENEFLHKLLSYSQIDVELSLLFTSSMRQNTLYCFTCHTSTMIRDQLVLRYPSFFWKERSSSPPSLIVIPAGKRRNSPPLFLEIFSRWFSSLPERFSLLDDMGSQAPLRATTTYLHGWHVSFVLTSHLRTKRVAKPRLAIKLRFCGQYF